jgi:hypothetical protein
LFRYRNNSVDEVFRKENTDHYEVKGANGTATIFRGPADGDVVGLAGDSGEGLYIDTKGTYTAVAPENGMKSPTQHVTSRHK